MELLTPAAWTLPLVVGIAAVIAARLPESMPRAAAGRWTEGPALPVAAAILSVLIVGYVWGGLDPVPFIHDEASYLLEAEMLARGTFAGPARPHPEFFEQYHVFVEPVLASRYPAGWPLALVPGVWLGLPVLVPLLLTGLTAALLVVLVRRIADAPTAVLAWLLWIGPPIALRFRPAFLSQHLSTFCWAAGLWALWRWHEEGRTRWLVLLSCLSAWQGITRPLTAVAFAIPVIAVVAVQVVKHRRWRQCAIALAAGLAVCAVLPFQNRAVTGDWTSLPMKAYALRVAPYDLPGFGLDTRRPEVPPTAAQKAYDRGFRPRHAEHVPERLPQILEVRLRQFVGQSAGPWGVAGLLALALVGLVTGGAPLALGGLVASALFLAYLWFAHPEQWVAYYMEAHLVFAAAAAVGAFRLAGRLTAWVAGPNDQLIAARVGAAILGVAAIVAVRTPTGIGLARDAHAFLARPHEIVREIETQLPAGSVLFIRYAPDHHIDRGLIENPADLAADPVWRVHDLGARNVELLRSAPDRAAFLLDEATWTVSRLAPDGVTLLPVDAPGGAGPAPATPSAPRSD